MLPALPAEWGRGSLRGIGLRTFATLDELGWDVPDGTVRAVLTAVHDQTVRLVCRHAGQDAERERRVDLPAGTPVTIEIRL